MGIGAAIVGGGLGVIGNLIQGNSQKQQANAAMQQQQAQYDAGQLATQPYRQAGAESLQQQQQLMTPQGQADFYNQYSQGPQFQMMQDQMQEQSAKASSAMGNLRSGQAHVAFGEIAPNLMNQAYTQRLQGLQGLTALGAGAAGQTAGLGAGMGETMGGYAGQSAGAMGNAFGQSLGQIGGLLANQMGKPKFGGYGEGLA